MRIENIYRLTIVLLIIIIAFQYFSKGDSNHSFSSENVSRKVDDSLTIMRGWNRFCFSGMSIVSYSPSKSDSGITYDLDIKPVQLEYKPMYNKVYRIDETEITPIDSSFYNFEPINIYEEYNANSLYFGVLWLPRGQTYHEFLYYLWFDGDNYQKKKLDKRIELIDSFYQKILEDSPMPYELKTRLENETR